MSGAEVSKFDARLDIVPTDPGVYLMKDASDSVIYVGKAKNLRNRLRSYFGKNPQGNAKVLYRDITKHSAWSLTPMRYSSPTVLSPTQVTSPTFSQRITLL